jgi:AbrB family looped-hinge helix DNA binding protein
MKAKLTSKGQITIPKGVRSRLKLRTGDEVEFIEEGKSFRIEKRRELSPWTKYQVYFGDLAGKDIDKVLDDWRGR